jgi:hypothetical protein
MGSTGPELPKVRREWQNYWGFQKESVDSDAKCPRFWGDLHPLGGSIFPRRNTPRPSNGLEHEWQLLAHAAAKFGQLTKIKQPASADLVARFGPMAKANDAVDVALLHALDIGVVDFLVSQAGRNKADSANRCAPPSAFRCRDASGRAWRVAAGS